MQDCGIPHSFQRMSGIEVTDRSQLFFTPSQQRSAHTRCFAGQGEHPPAESRLIRNGAGEVSNLLRIRLTTEHGERLNETGEAAAEGGGGEPAVG